MSRDRARVQRNVTLSTQRTREALADARATANDPTQSARVREIAAAEARSHRNFLAECRDAQRALDDGEYPQGWA